MKEKPYDEKLLNVIIRLLLLFFLTFPFLKGIFDRLSIAIN